jgi:hypothetical protein
MNLDGLLTDPQCATPEIVHCPSVSSAPTARFPLNAEALQRRQTAAAY